MNEETIAGVVGWGKVVGCIASSITVDLCEPGHVRRAAGKSGDKHTVFRTGEVHGRITDRVTEIKRLVSYSDSALATTNLWGERWSKLVTNAMANGMSASTGLISKAILTNDALRRFGARLGSRGDPRRPGSGLRTGGSPPYRSRNHRQGRRGRSGGDQASTTSTGWPRCPNPAAVSIVRRWVRTW